MDNKNLLITGASSGIGQYVVKTLAARGWYIFAGYRDEKDAAEIKKINPANIQPLYLDVTRDESILAAREIIEKSGRKLDVLFNNAGLAIGGPLESLEIAEIKKIYEVNFFGVIRLIQNFLPLLRLSRGRIINISSISGVFTVPFTIPYSASKHSIEALSDGLRRELRDQRIKVIMIEPGSLKTPIWRKTIDWSNQALSGQEKTLAYYQPEFANFIKAVETNVSGAAAVSKLKAAIISAAESPCPRARYRGYFSNWLFAIFIKFIPARLADSMFKLFLK